MSGSYSEKGEMSGSYSEKREMMEIEIKFSKGRTDRILVYFGDDPEELAKVSVFLLYSSL